jgi:hypothetical protein
LNNSFWRKTHLIRSLVLAAPIAPIDPLLPVTSDRSAAMARWSYLLRRLLISGFENVYQNSAAPIPKITEHRRDMEKPQAMVSVPSDRIVSIAHNDSGVAQIIWIRTRCPFSDELHHLKNLFCSIPVPIAMVHCTGAIDPQQAFATDRFWADQLNRVQILCRLTIMRSQG